MPNFNFVEIIVKFTVSLRDNIHSSFLSVSK
jgi:hypothetical protein